MRTRISQWRLGLIAGMAFSAVVSVDVAAAKPTLKIGDPAPALTPMAWLKGAPVSNYEPGRVYLVDFWATWCPPCIESMPHLSALQKKHADKLTVIGVNAEALGGYQEAKPDQVRAFVKKKGEKMAYTVVMDDPAKETMVKSWMTASGLFGLPSAFIVDQRGRVVWIGSPAFVQDYAFDQALEDTLAGKPDLTEHAPCKPA